jgi:hypothetical protein
MVRFTVHRIPEKTGPNRTAATLNFPPQQRGEICQRTGHGGAEHGIVDTLSQIPLSELNVEAVGMRIMRSGMHSVRASAWGVKE